MYCPGQLACSPRPHATTVEHFAHDANSDPKQDKSKGLKCAPCRLVGAMPTDQHRSFFKCVFVICQLCLTHCLHMCGVWYTNFQHILHLLLFYFWGAGRETPRSKAWSHPHYHTPSIFNADFIYFAPMDCQAPGLTAGSRCGPARCQAVARSSSWPATGPQATSGVQAAGPSPGLESGGA